MTNRTDDRGMPQMSERMVLVGPQWQLDLWKKMFGDSVDYVLSVPLPVAATDEG